MSDKKLGRQTPTSSVVLPYRDSCGSDAVDIYNRSGRTAQEWQERMLEDIMALNEENLWVHMKFGWSIPRRNGKSEILIIRAMYGVSHNERVLYTAHRTTTSHNAWEKVIERLSKAGFVEGEDFKTTKQFGLERIEWLGTDGVINFRTRSSKGGLGEGYDLLIIDEAQEYTTDQESALKYVVTDSKNPQTLMCGTPPTAVSSGTVFLSYRKEVFSGKAQDSGWAEWSVPELTDAHNPELWYETNPSLGTILSERTIRSELGDDQVDDNIQRLGLWLRYNQKSAISKEEWESYTADTIPKIKADTKLYFGVKYAKTTANVSLSVAFKTDNKIFVEAIDCRPVRDGNQWLIEFLRSKRAEKVVIDGAGNQSILEADMKNEGVKCKAVLPKVAEIVEANALFEKKLFDGEIIHKNQPALTQAVANCEHRAIGSGGGYGYASILEGADISLLESVTLAHWLCANAKEKKKQVISY
ncbi:MAG: terminase [Oscillospiraceae bacterium]|nr:terminase [Oscillospiraceae bacterium]MBQ8378487.1 terminase [Oscillospiraceae bacterium]MBQ8884480.1 terminase [Oscillospiraceae bacterium]